MLARVAIAAFAAALLLGLAGNAWAADIGFRGPSTSGAGSQPSGVRPESKLWFNDGLWWSVLWNSSTARYEIYKRSAASETWSTTGTVVDTRADAHADALWSGSKLYIATHRFVSAATIGAADAARLYRFGYSAATQQYSLDVGFPATISNIDSETLVIDRDSLGNLWATWVYGGSVWVNRTSGNDAVWGTPYAIPTANASGLPTDDISSLIAFGGKVGVMWGNQNTDTMYFGVHVDGAPDASWTQEVALGSPGSNMADDHINLKTSAGVVYAATKTSKTAANDPLIVLSVRSTSGTWTSTTFGTGAYFHTRPILLLDEAAGTIHMFAGGPQTAGSSSYAVIWEKETSMASPSFASGLGTAFIDPDSTSVNNPTSTKQNISQATGIVVLAAGGSRFWHNFENLAPPPPPSPPVNTVLPSVSGTPAVGQILTADPGTWTGTAPITYTYLWQRCSPGTCTDIGAPSPSNTYLVDVADVDSTLRVRVLASNSIDTDVAADSAQTPTVTPAPTTLTFNPVADTNVQDSSPTSNYGTATTLRLRSPSPTYTSYLKFDVTGLSGAVVSAKLRLYSTDGSPDGGSLYTVSNNFLGTTNPWTETGLNWNNAPAIAGTPIATAGNVATAAWIELDVTSAVTGNGTYSLGLKNASTNSVYYSSRQGTNPPQLVITLAP